MVDEGEVAGMVFPDRDWLRAEPESQSLDSARLDEAMEYIRHMLGEEERTNQESMVIRNGYLLWEGAEVGDKHVVYSATKAFTSTVFGVLRDQGKCDLDDYACDYLPLLREKYSGVTMRHFLTMTSGYRGSKEGGPLTPNEPLFEPGTKYIYNSAPAQFANALTRAAGEPLKDVFKRCIADPIGMDPGEWSWGDYGEINGILLNGGAGIGDTGMAISARQTARMGHLFLNRGRWRDEQVISEEWVAMATSVQVPVSVPPNSPKGWYIFFPGIYGMLWWVNGVNCEGTTFWAEATPGTCAIQGGGGGACDNICFVIPEWDMVVVRFGNDGTPGDYRVYNEFFKRLRAAFLEPGAGS